MDVTQARTFLAIADTGSFVEAAKRVHVTQSTVSMRIKALEEQLGVRLFERNKSGAALTVAGTQFHRHALAFVRIWEQARLETALPEGYRSAFTVGASYSIWDGFLIDWLPKVRTDLPDIAIRAQVGTSAVLMERLIEGTLDIGVMYSPQRRSGLAVELLYEDELVLVSSEAEPQTVPGNHYVYVDWGPEFLADHSLNFPNLKTPGLYFELSSLSLKYLHATHGSAYFPRRLIAPILASADAGLALVPDAPVFSYPVYVVYPVQGNSEALSQMLATLTEMAAASPIPV